MKKLFKIAIPILLLCIIGLFIIGLFTFFAFPTNKNENKNETENAFDVSNLKPDQKNAYIALSENSTEGYNRWLPFYFTFSEKSDIDAPQVESILNENIKKATLYMDNKAIYQTEKCKR